MSEKDENPLSDDDIIDPEIFEKLENTPTREILAQIVMGPYPPPDMMEEYKRRCPEVYDQIVKGVEQQRHHRIKIETEQSESALATRRRNSSHQTIFSYIALVASIAIIGWQIVVNERVDHYFFPIILAILAIGGKPTATIAAKVLERLNRSES